MLWYHGSPYVIDHFNLSFVGKGQDQLGSGIYFTSDKETASGYAGQNDDKKYEFKTVDPRPNVSIVKLNFEKLLDPKKKFKKKEIINLMKSSPTFSDDILNFGDVEWDGENVILENAANSYLSLNRSDDAIDVLNAISNDFWKGHESLFLKACVQVTGIQGLVRKIGNELFAVVWDTSIIAPWYEKKMDLEYENDISFKLK